MHEYLHRFDRTVGHAIKLLPDWMSPLMHAGTFMGEPVVVLTAGAVIAITAWFKSSYFLLKASIFGFGAFGVNALIKFAVHRSRPDTMFAHSMRIKSYSFPSGHAFGAMFFYGLLAYLAYTRLPVPWGLVVTALLSALIMIIGVSRVYLGAHFPSDVVVGWLFGAVCLVLAITLFHV